MAEASPKKPVGQTAANLTDGKLSYGFLLAPETLQWSHSADYATVSVLGANDPDINWRSSTSSLSIPRLLFVSQGMTEDISESIQQLTAWCRIGATLKFTLGSTAIARCHISRFNPKETQWRSGKCTQAEASLDLIISRVSQVASEPTVTKVGGYTPRERENTNKAVLDALKNPAKAKKLKAGSGTQVSTAEDGYVTLRDLKGVLFGTYRINDLKTQGIIK